MLFFGNKQTAWPSTRINDSRRYGYVRLLKKLLGRQYEFMAQRSPRTFRARNSLFAWCNHVPKPAFKPFQGIMKLDILAIHRLKTAPID
jgi:hypothetical protein